MNKRIWNNICYGVYNLNMHLERHILVYIRTKQHKQCNLVCLYPGKKCPSILYFVSLVSWLINFTPSTCEAAIDETRQEVKHLSVPWSTCVYRLTRVGETRFIDLPTVRRNTIVVKKEWITSLFMGMFCYAATCCSDRSGPPFVITYKYKTYIWYMYWFQDKVNYLSCMISFFLIIISR